MRLLLALAIALAWPGCDSVGDAVDDERIRTYRVVYRVDGDVVVADSVKYRLGTGEVIHTSRATVPFNQHATLQPGGKAEFWVSATPFNPFQPLPNKEVTVIATILVDDVVVETDTVRGVRNDPLALYLTSTMPE